MTAIVIVNVSQTVAPAPATLQKTGAMLSQGGTTTSQGAKTLLTELADLTPIIVAPAALTSAVWATTQVTTITTTQVHNLPLHDVIDITLAGITGSVNVTGFNGTFECTVTGTSTFTYVSPLTTSPGSGTGGTWQDASAAELLSMATTFFAQGSQQAAYVLELGAGNPSEGVATLTTWISNNPNVFYSYLVPRLWDSVAAFLALLNQNESTTAKTYFFTTTTLATWQNYTALQKSCFAMIEAPATGVWPGNALTALAFTGAWGANTLTALTWAATNGGQATATTTTVHGVLPGELFSLTGCTPAGYNVTNAVALEGTMGSTLIYALAVDPGTETGLGSLVASAQGTASATTTTVHGVLVGQYFSITGSVASVIAAGYNGTFLALPGTTGSTLLYALPANPGTESVLGMLVASQYASAGVAVGEFSLAAAWWVTLNYNPSTTNKVTPTSNSFLFDVTPFPTQGNAAILNMLQNASINVVSTGAEGGISTATLVPGQTKDGRDFTYWYSVDWVQINLNRNLAAAIINGSNTPINPLYYNQNGINRLQGVAASTMNSGLTFGLVLGAVTQTQLDGPAFAAALDAGTFDDLTVVNAVPFVNYTQENPDDYPDGIYGGFATSYTPARGFEQILFNVNVTDFPTQ